MKIKNTIPLPEFNLTDSLTDNVTIKLIGSNPHVDVITLDPTSLGLVSRFQIDTIAHDSYSSCIDHDCIYLPTKLGQILALDKFSGEILTTINLEMPIMSNVVQDDNKIYCICGVPLSQKLNLNLDNFCVCICDKETGNKEIQTNYFIGIPRSLIKNDNFIWVIGGEYLIQYSCDGEYLKKSHLGTNFEHNPIETNKHIICVSTTGIVRILDKNTLELFDNAINARPCISDPILVHDQLIWVTTSGICCVSLKEKGFKEFMTNENMLSNSILSPDNKVFFAFGSGNVFSFKLDEHTIEKIKISEEVLQIPVIADNHLITTSSTKLYQLMIE